GEVFAQLAADSRAATTEAVVRGDVRGVAFTRSGRTVAYLWSTGEPAQPGTALTLEALTPGTSAGDTIGAVPVRVVGATSAAGLWKGQQ
ncbi:MAG: hypothetical protein ACRCXL_15315, partial [Dermatophilaceae bacterium]